MIDNGLVAISSNVRPSYPILIVAPNTYSIIKEITIKKYITKCSSLCVLDPHSFIYAYKGEGEYLIVQDSAETTETGFKVIKPYY